MYVCAAALRAVLSCEAALGVLAWNATVMTEGYGSPVVAHSLDGLSFDAAQMACASAELLQARPWLLNLG